MDINTIITITVVLVIALFILVFVVSLFSKKPDDSWKQEFKQKLNKVAQNTDPNNPQSLKFAVLEYDKLLDHALKMHRVKGETLGEKLKNAKSTFSNRDLYEKAWQVHKVRNQIAHDVNLDHQVSTLQSVIYNFKQVLSSLI